MSVNIEIPVKIGTAGRAQIPFEVREKLDLREGDFLLIRIEKVIKAAQGDKEASA